MKYLIPLLAVALSACAGYAPLYGEKGEVLKHVQVADVRVENPDRLPGERRIAQLVRTRLNQAFTGKNADKLTVVLDEDSTALAINRDATEERLQLTLQAEIMLESSTGDLIYRGDLATTAPYNVEASPFGTDAGRTQARESAARALAEEIIRRVAHVYSQKKP